MPHYIDPAATECPLAFCFVLISSTKLGPFRVANSTSLLMRCSRPASDGGGADCGGATAP